MYIEKSYQFNSKDIHKSDKYILNLLNHHTVIYARTITTTSSNETCLQDFLEIRLRIIINLE